MARTVSRAAGDEREGPENTDQLRQSEREEMNNVIAECIHTVTNGVRRRSRFIALHNEIGRHTCQTFDCPICLYRGGFLSEEAPTGKRHHARCPSCGALERHRLQWLVV